MRSKVSILLICLPYTYDTKKRQKVVRYVRTICRLVAFLLRILEKQERMGLNLITLIGRTIVLGALEQLLSSAPSPTNMHPAIYLDD